MIINKEFYEILNLIKDIVKFNDTEFCVFNPSKESLQNMLVNNPQIKKLIEIIKEKNKMRSSLNNNFFHIINNTNKKNYKDFKIIIATLNNFSLTYNEPKYIEGLNVRIYERIKAIVLEEMQKSYLIQISNGKTSEPLLNDENKTETKIVIPNAEHILPEIYKTRNENLILNGDEIYSFKLKKCSLFSLKSKFEAIINNHIEPMSDLQITRKIEQIDNLVSSRNITELLNLLEKGIPNSVRKKVYMYLLEISGDHSLNSNSKNTETFNEIYDNMMVVDLMVIEDSEEILKNEHYFLFYEIIKKILYRFYRDDKLFTEVQVNITK